MAVEHIFIYATKNKLRFPYKGNISTEDLWNLPVTALDEIFKTLNAKRKATSEESLLNQPTKEDDDLDAQIKIVKYIVNFKLEERRANEEAAEKSARRQKILAIKEAKQDEVLKNSSIEELDKMLDELK